MKKLFFIGILCIFSRPYAMEEEPVPQTNIQQLTALDNNAQDTIPAQTCGDCLLNCFVSSLICLFEGCAGRQD
jgi:hypothetical protein